MSAAMQNQLKDYYSTLGVDEDAEEKTIKDAYRRLARKWHPDSNKDDPDAEERFKEVAEAWAVLGDAQKRREYDLARSGQGVFEFDPSDLFGDGLGSIFGSLFGGGGGFNGGGARMQTIIHQRISRRVPARLLLKGGTLNVDGRAVEVPPLTPAEVVLQERTPSRILEIELEPFVPEGLVDGADIHIVRKVPYTTLALGGDLDVEGIEGSLTVTVKPGTPGGSRLRLQDQGLPHYRGGRGALFVLVETAVPEQPSDEVRAQLERLRELGL